METILTTTVKIKSEVVVLLPVKTDKPIDVEKIGKAMKRIAKINVKAPITVGDIIVRNFVIKGVNLVSTKTVER